MPASKEGYRISAVDIPSLSLQLNFHLQSIANRLDQIEGFRGTSTINSNLDLQNNALVNVGNFDQNLGTDDNPQFGGLTIDGDMAVTGIVDGDVIRVVDSNGTVIHQFGDSV